MQLQVTNSPFSQEQVDLLNQLLPTLTENQKIWLSGYLASQANSGAAPAAEGPAVQESVAPQASQAEAASKEVTILFGSQTGNGQMIAEDSSRRLKDQGYNVTVSSMDDFKTKNMKKVENLLVIVSTHGEGDPPDNAISFHEFLNGRKAPKLEDARFSVLALGDTSYEYFCQTGKDFDQRLEDLGGTRLYPRVDCDVDFDDDAEEWIQGVLSSLNELQEETAQAAAAPAGAAASAAPATEQPAYSRTNPFRAEILDNINLNGRGSAKETRHVELSLEGSGLTFEPGDSLGMFPENDPLLVDQLIREMDWNPEETVVLNKQGDIRSLREALLSHFEITVLTKPLLEKMSKLTNNEKIQELLDTEHADDLRSYLEGRDLLDLLKDYGPWQGGAADVVGNLRKIPPRLYSIASSPSANPDEVHLTVGAVRYDAHGRPRTGVCSGQCAERTEPGDTLPIYIQHNPNFKLPDNPSAPVIMVGPGTGIAPFRSFVEEREEVEADGKSWLFFGDQHFRTDFLYQTEWQQWLEEGSLSKMDVAFSRDNEEKIYVQHRILENSEEVYQWLQDGAFLYICGDEKRMAHDVHEALVSVLEKEGNMTHEEAEAYMLDLQQQKRYQRDVY
ncbi:assimilatory sulfite reductase (NADPH) flavoprotein subunit [Marinococcus sp. PL1-022]|uniref:assimilatory sulfite reductase (NADPH) flavoprotein subunit n=1 Tax=Marinococcus sp. PL1-022 TaxID=3095363 RepID=UPI0029C16DCF|nr:assimilatory sulfite reductase (NADPH) flavoprotein subunit [Marinococcus sp. PL1-022]MDX6153282.1 assimilatory sulfite reductase (NADPH) flavoprotein subunit [Marinococcus sp. PL1-022]